MRAAVTTRARRRSDVPEATVARLPVYLRALHALADRGLTTVSSEALASSAGVGSAKLRKDLSHLGSYGTRGVGYDVAELVSHISGALGLGQRWAVVLVGAEVGWVARALVDRLATGAELLTAVLGEAAPSGLAEELQEHVRARHPQVELTVIEGGQPLPVCRSEA